MRLVVTRPQAQAAPWVQALRALGHDAAALPLIAIAPPADAAPVQAAWSRLAGTALVMFVSANAVAQFFALAPAGAAWPATARAAATGPGTVAALRAAGVPDAAIVAPPADAARFDSEALWPLIAGDGWAGRDVLVVRGEEGRDWLAEQLQERGARVAFVAAYRRLAPTLTPPQAALLAEALAAPAQHLWLFSSSQAVRHLAALAPAAPWQGAIASHPRIARSALDIGFRRVLTCAPTPPAVAALAAAWHEDRPLQSFAP